MDFKHLALVTLVSMAISTLIGRYMIPMLKSAHIGQNIRDDGPKAHMSKQGTPTMGGIIIIITLILGLIVGFEINLPLGIVVVSTFGFGAVGFADDFMKLIMKRSLGLTAMQKIVFQVLVSFIVIWMYRLYDPTAFSKLLIPFTGNFIDIGFLAYPLYIVMLIGAVNAVNLTDGLDGLLSSVTVPVLLVLCIIASRVVPEIQDFIMVLEGAILGFLVYNSNRASVFMGDTGSMTIGGAIAAAALVTKTTLLLPILGLIYVAEAGSVVIQVISYKTRNKKRVFLMSPIHHHYEMKKIEEQKIVTNFAIVSIAASLLALIAYL